MPSVDAVLLKLPGKKMEPNLQITGEGNCTTFLGSKYSKTVIRIKGDHNAVSFGKNSTSNEILINIFGKNNRVLVGKNCKIRGHILVKGEGQTIKIGDFTTFTNCYLLAQEGCDIRIGRHCMFSRGIEIRTTDAHSVVSLETGERLNSPGSVTIGDHVWIAANVLISKGVTIADDCIIGAGASVFKDITESHTISVGTPAHIIRRGVTWSRIRKARFPLGSLNAWRHE
jgi:acetyltransferase-like isoleucine patch superfamily enzyme